MADVFKSQPGLFGYLSSTVPKLEEAGLVKLEYNNSLLIEFLEKEKNKIIQQLKRQLQSSQVDVDFVYVDKEDNSKVYTEEDKLRKLLEKHPVFEKFKKDFDLDFD